MLIVLQFACLDAAIVLCQRPATIGFVASLCRKGPERHKRAASPPQT